MSIVQPFRRSISIVVTDWRSSINNARAEIVEIIEDSPSLRPTAFELLAKGYGLSRKNAIAETGLAPKTFPEEKPYSLEQVLSDDFWPEDLA